NQSVHSYRGIPYAAPPIGALRWAPPSTPTPWTDTVDATVQGNVCVQAAFGGLPIPGFSPSEDCLFLNVDTPAEGSGLPVMVWIHGGAFTLGEGLQADGGTAGDRIARETGTVVVSMNYRLGQFGFLAHSALSGESPTNASGNYGLLDQTAALEWVQQNIAEFGGDPDNVTIFGESAGAFSVCSHLVSPRSAGLFDKAILQSGSCERPFPGAEAAEAQGDAFADALGCGGETDADGVLDCMRAADADAVLAALPPTPNFGFTTTTDGTTNWGPVIDGLFMTEQPATSFESGNFTQVPTLIGFTRGEARLFVWLAEIADDPLAVTEENYEALIAFLIGGNATLAAQAVAEYPLDDFSEPAEALAAVATDTIFRCPAKQEATNISAFVPDTYLFQFEYPNARFQLEPFLFLLEAELPAYGLDAFHGADISYVFGYDPLLEVDLMTFEATLRTWSPGSIDERLWLDTIGYFTRFAATGDPNGSGAVEWLPYDPDTDEYLILDAPIAAGTNAAPRCRSFWEDTDYLASPLLAEND
ncbi:MAG: carboxylesterase family protein, partial [Polyangiales bacterium]